MPNLWRYNKLYLHDYIDILNNIILNTSYNFSDSVSQSVSAGQYSNTL